MKVAVSLPDPLFKRADREARRRKMSRSGIVAEALAAYFTVHDRSAEIAEINRVIADDPDSFKLEPNLERAQFAVLPRDK